MKKNNNSVHPNRTTTRSHPLMGDGIIMELVYIVYQNACRYVYGNDDIFRIGYLYHPGPHDGVLVY